MTTSNLFPNSTISNTNCAVTGASAHAALAAVSTADYVDIGTVPALGSVEVGLDDLTLPAGAVIDRVRVFFTLSSSGLVHLVANVATGGAQLAGDLFAGAYSTATKGGSFVYTRGDGAFFQDADIDGMSLRFTDDSSAAAVPRIFQAWVEVTYLVKPTVTITAPTTGGTLTNNASFPAVTWTYASAESRPQHAYQVKIFTDAQASLGGFDPETTPALYDSGIVSSATASHSFWSAYSPPNNQLLRIYVKAAQTTGQGNQFSDWQFVTQTYDFSPNVPTLLTPASGQKVDAAAGFTATWTYSHRGDSPQAAYAFRRKNGIGGTYEYWRDSDDTWQATAQWNTSLVGSAAFGAGNWANGNTYYWSVATQDSDGDQGAFATDKSFVSNARPVASLSYPSGTATVIDTTQPFITWGYSDAEGDPQEAWRVFVYDTDGSSTYAHPYWDTGYVIGTDSSVQVGSIRGNRALVNGHLYAVVVQVYSNNQWSLDGTGNFLMSLDTPASPVLTAIDDPGLARVRLDAVLQDNMLSKLLSDSEGATGWSGTNATVAPVFTPTPEHGVAITALTGTNTTGAIISAPAENVPVLGNQQYSAIARMRSNTTTRSFRVQIVWYDAAHASISTSQGSLVASSNSAWTSINVTATAPSNAVTATVQITTNGNAIGEVHYIDLVKLNPGAVTTWSRGGFSPVLDFEFLDASGVWLPVRSGTGVTIDQRVQTATLYDYEAPAKVSRAYRCMARGTL